MTTRVYTVKGAIRLCEDYIRDDRPMNIEEMKSVKEVLEKFFGACGKCVEGVSEKVVPSHLRNDWMFLKREAER